MKKFIIIPLVTLLISCGAASVKTNITNNSITEKLKHTEVFLINDAKDLPENSILIGDIKIGDNGMSTKCSKEEIIKDAKESAKVNNSNIVLIEEITPPNNWSSCYGLKGKLYHNNTENINKLIEANNSIFDKNADFAKIHFICKSEYKSISTDMHLGLVGGKFHINLGNEKFKIYENTIVEKEINNEGEIEISGSSYTRGGKVKLNIKKGSEYYVTVTTQSNMGVRVVLQEVSKIEGEELINQISKLSK
jgi:hypothetical protein